MCLGAVRHLKHAGLGGLGSGCKTLNVTLLLALKVSEPFELVGMDLVGKLKCSNTGHQYMCVMVDYFTKWIEVCPLKTKKAEEVTECIMVAWWIIWRTQTNPHRPGQRICEQSKLNSEI